MSPNRRLNAKLVAAGLGVHERAVWSRLASDQRTGTEQGSDQQFRSRPPTGQPTLTSAAT